MKYNIGLPMVSDYDDKQPFFVEISTIITKMYIESTIKEGGVVDHMNVVDVPPAQVDQFELICDKYNIQFDVVQS